MLATEHASLKLPPAERPAFRADIVGVLRNAKPPKPNLTREERAAYQTLSKDENILILPADKGRSTVVMDKVEEMLSDESTYKKLTNDPTTSIKRKLVDLLKPLKDEGKIEKTEYKEL